jgi:hypothetical protein
MAALPGTPPQESASASCDRRRWVVSARSQFLSTSTVDLRECPLVQNSDFLDEFSERPPAKLNRSVDQKIGTVGFGSTRDLRGLCELAGFFRAVGSLAVFREAVHVTPSSAEDVPVAIASELRCLDSRLPVSVGRRCHAAQP